MRLVDIQECRQLQHPHLAEFCDIDMKMVEVTLGELIHVGPFQFPSMIP
jgi:hypothetical protein